MHQIGADARRRVKHGHDLDPGLHELIADDYADVARADHQHALAGLDAVDVHQRLDGARAVDAGQIGVGEGQGFFVSAGGADDGLCPDLAVFLLVLQDGDHVVLIEAHGGGVEQELDFVAEFREPFQQNTRNIHAPVGGVLPLRAEEHVGLLDELSAGLEAALQNEHLRAGRGRGDGGAETGGAGADNQQFDFSHSIFPFPSCV